MGRMRISMEQGPGDVKLNSPVPAILIMAMAALTSVILRAVAE